MVPLEIAAVVAGMIAVSAMVHGSVLLLRETRIAVQVITQRAANVRERVRQGQPLVNDLDKQV